MTVDLSKLTERHYYEIAALNNPGEWGVYCGACSHSAEDFIYPCARDVAGDEDVPPMVLYAHEKVQDLIRVGIFDLAHQGRILVSPDGFTLSWFDGKPIMLPIIDTSVVTP
jgi:hypothetical protein